MQRDEPRNMESLLGELGAAMTPRVGEQYQEVRDRLRRASEAFHNLLAAELSGPFNAHFREAPKATLDEKRELARQSNADLRQLGVAIKCPKTGLPAFLGADGSRNEDRGRFQLCMKRDGKKRLTLTRARAFEVELMGHLRHDHVQRQAEIGAWTARVDEAGTSPLER